MKLEVHSAMDSDTYLDYARVPREYRKDRHGQPIERGAVCRVYCAETGREAFVILHGLDPGEGQTIRIDEHVRQKLNVKNHHAYDFDLREADFCGEVWWALHATDMRFRFPAKISLVSLALGLLGLVIAVLGARH